MSAEHQDILVTVIGGYLGAGKTSLLNHVLAEADERIVVLVNDFGDINIDADLVASADGDTITLENGCICCTLADGFATALDVIAALPHRPPRLVVEASGVADPGQIAAYAHHPGFRLDGTITVVDTPSIQKQHNDVYVGDTVARQLRAADLLVLNKVDLCSDNSAGVVDWMRQIGVAAPMVTATNGRVPLPILLGVTTSDTPLVHETAHNALLAADETFSTWSKEWAEPVARGEFEALVNPDESAGVVRLKGVVRLADDPDTRLVVQRVGARLSITEDGPWRGGPSRLVAIAVRHSVT